MKQFAALASLILLAACATASVDAPPPPPGGATIPSTPLDLGDWRNASASQTLAAFEGNASSRYGAGLAISAAAGDLRGQDFTCSAPPRADAGRGAPPAQVCRRTVTAANCTHTWQVHLFDTNGDGRLVRSRGIYDRRCGNDGLLGGPG